MSNVISFTYKSQEAFLELVKEYQLQQHEQLLVQSFSFKNNEKVKSEIEQIVRQHIPQAKLLHSKVKKDELWKNIVTAEDVYVLITMVCLSSYSSKNENDKIRELSDNLAFSKEEYRSLFENNDDFIFSTDYNGKIRSVNPAFEKTFGYEENELINHRADSFLKSIDQNRVKQYYPEILEGKKLSFTTSVFTKTSEEKICRITIVPITLEENLMGFYAIGRDITKEFEVEQRIASLTYYDYDTGLPNRTKISQKLDFQIEGSRLKKKKFALLLIDIDRFKNINDSFGHYVGDVVLKKLADRIKKVIPEGAFFGRFEGDKFSLLLDSAEVDYVMGIANEILACVYQPINHEKIEFFVTASIGISMYPEDGTDAETLIRHADLAMHRSKSTGGGQIEYYCPNMNQKAVDRLELESFLRKALYYDELYLVYQPLINLEDGKMFGSEALIRWMHPILGLIPPLDFIPIAEEIGLIGEIGSWVLNEACKQNKQWQKDGFEDLSISVNVSAKQFQEPGFIKIVKDALSNADLEAKYLTLELTESVMLENIEYSISVMKQLQTLGVKVSIDDFGTGYSSLSYLRNLPIDTLKIDRTFINNMQLDTSDIAIVKAIIMMGEGLGVKIVAEGVETLEQLDLLTQLDCHYAQGYYIDRPLDVKEFEHVHKVI